MQYKHEYGVELEELLRKIALDKNKSFMREFLFDLLSPAEYRDFAVRWQIVKMVNNKVPHRNIAKNLKVSVATVGRAVRELENKKGGFRLAVDKYTKIKPLK
jgi:TrpR family trp operon transcriptional repressor